MPISSSFKVTRKSGTPGVQSLKVKPGAVKVGVLKGAGKHPGPSRRGVGGGVVSNPSKHPTMAVLGHWLEYGTQNSPPRPHLRATIRRNRKKYASRMKFYFRAMLQKRLYAARAQSLLGAEGAGDVKEAITRFNTPPNSPRTVLIKGVNNPLIDTGSYRKSITWGVM